MPPRRLFALSKTIPRENVRPGLLDPVAFLGVEEGRLGLDPVALVGIVGVEQVT